MKKFGRLEATGAWPTLQAAGMDLAATEYTRDDGVHMLHFQRWQELRLSQRGIVSGNSTRVIFRTRETGAMLLGLSVEHNLRGLGVGRALVEYFIGNTQAQTGAEFEGTGLIHKPDVALCLDRAGLRPESDAFQVELLPSSAFYPPKTPQVMVVKNELSPDAIVTGAGTRQFYEAVDPAQVARTYPSNGPGMVVALHTRYH